MTPKVKWKLRKARDGSFYFVQESSANGETLATSEMYTRRESAVEGAAAAGCPDGELRDDTGEES